MTSSTGSRIDAITDRAADLTRRTLTALRPSRQPERLYADDVVVMDQDGLTIRRYYWPAGRKRIAYQDINSYQLRGLTIGRGQYRVHGIDMHGNWYSRDPTRQHKDCAIVLDTGSRIDPILTPDNPNTVVQILERHILSDPDGKPPTGSPAMPHIERR